MNPPTAWETDPQRQEIRILSRRVWVAWYSGQHERARGFAEKLNALLLEMSGFERDESEAETLTEPAFPEAVSQVRLSARRREIRNHG